MKSIIAIAALLLSVNSFATGIPVVDEIPQADFDKINTHIKAEAMKELANTMGSFPMKSFSVDWNSAECVQKYLEMGDQNIAVCMVPFGAFQVHGYAAVTVNSGTYKASIISADVE